MLLAALAGGAAPRLLVACLVGAIDATAIAALVNRRSKLSVHAGSAAGCAVLTAQVVPATAPLLPALLALVGRARVRLGHHTPLQVALGAVVGGACTAAALRAFGV